MMSYKAAVITVSDKGYRGERVDTRESLLEIVKHLCVAVGDVDVSLAGQHVARSAFPGCFRPSFD